MEHRSVIITHRVQDKNWQNI